MLRGESVVLRAPQPDDRASFIRLRNDVALQTALMALPRANSARRVDEWLEGILADPASLFFTVANGDMDECVGFIQLRRLDFVHGHGELGVGLEPKARGRSFATEAIQLLERHAIEVFRIRKVTLQVLASNPAAIRCYQKCGYREVGTLKEHFYHNQSYHDVVIMEHLLAVPSN
jgi:diamine N-acetyltransferase